MADGGAQWSWKSLEKRPIYARGRPSVEALLDLHTHVGEDTYTQYQTQTHPNTQSRCTAHEHGRGKKGRISNVKFLFYAGTVKFYTHSRVFVNTHDRIFQKAEFPRLVWFQVSMWGVRSTFNLPQLFAKEPLSRSFETMDLFWESNSKRCTEARTWQMRSFESRVCTWKLRGGFFLIERTHCYHVIPFLLELCVLHVLLLVERFL